MGRNGMSSNVSSLAIPPLPAESEYCVIARAHDSIGSRGRWRAFWILATLSLALALAFAAVGAWLVLPYSLLEVGLLAAAFAWCERHAGDWERLVVAGDQVVVEQAAGSKRHRREFNRYRLRVAVEHQGLGRTPHVILRGGGAACEFGNALPVAERLAVARELRRLTGLR
jgi:uncharacterized membrane protein